MAERVQTYKNHSRLLPPFHLFVVPVLLLNALNAIRHIWLVPNRSTLWAFIVSVALLMLGLLSRIQAVTVQDRVIRLEMRLRLRQVLPPELQPRINDLTHRQLIALRFASDDELPQIVREVLDGKLATTKEIKLRVKNWQADGPRA